MYKSMSRVILLLSLLLTVLLTACHDDDVFHWITPEAVSVVPTVTSTPEPTVVPEPQPTIRPEVLPEEEGEIIPDPIPSPTCDLIKGNISADGRKLYHMVGMRNYNQTKINEEAGERWFCTEQEAIDAGWTKATN